MSRPDKPLFFWQSISSHFSQWAAYKITSLVWFWHLFLHVLLMGTNEPEKNILGDDGSVFPCLYFFDIWSSSERPFRPSNYPSIHLSIHHSCLSFSCETLFPFVSLLTSVLFYTYLSRKHQFIVSHVDILWQSSSGFVGMNHQCQTPSQVCATWAIPSALTQISLAERWELLTFLFSLIAHLLLWPEYHLLNPFTPPVSTLQNG